MNNPNYSWIPAYEEIATKLLDYEDRQDELCGIVEDILGEHFDKMDPLTFFSMFNGKRKGNSDGRFGAVRTIIERFGLDVDVPTDFDGVPVTNPQRWQYWDGKPDTIRHNWELFRAAVRFADGDDSARDDLTRLFDVVRAQGNIGDASLTMALYWARPNTYIPFDGNTRAYLRNRFDIGMATPIKGESYLGVLEKLPETASGAIRSVSYAAWEVGGWVPAPSEYDPGITADTWEGVLRDPETTSASMLVALRCLAMHPDGVTCEELNDDYGRGANFYSNAISSLGEAVCEQLGVKPCSIETVGQFWPVVCLGSHVGKSRRHGSFEWKLRPEIAEAIDRIDEGKAPLVESEAREGFVYNSERLARLVALYKQDFPRFRLPGGEEGDQESYKWDDARAYQENWDIDAEGADFAERLRAALSPSSTGRGALLGNGYSYPFSRLSKLVDFDAEGVREAFRVLYDPNRPLRDAYNSFCDAVDAVLQEHDETTDSPLGESHQTPSAVSLYLAFEMPERYHFFKPSVGESFAECVGVKLPKDKVAKLLSYEKLADAVLSELIADSELVALSDSALTEEQREADPAHHLMLQDIAYYASNYMKSWHADWAGLLDGGGSTDREGGDVALEGVTYPKNMILYGPPGTGKTYRTRAYAVAICDGRRVEDVLCAMADPDGFAEVSERYDRLVAEGRVNFTTFHQSYGYEEFIEGLRPEYDEEKSVVTYPLRKGAFRDFCEAAEDLASLASADEGVPRFSANPRPRVWKMGLKADGVPDLLKSCRAEGSLRMGWDDVRPDEVEDSEGITDRNRRAISAFQEEMEPGDFVVIPVAGSTHHDVAVVTGDFEWGEGVPGARRRRKAQWIGSIAKSDFLPINDGKMLTLQTVYELTRVSPSKLLEAMGMSGKTKASPQASEPYVFIIDEINRGNVSKIFGELITLLEPSKRKGAPEETLVRLPYSGEMFGVPGNVHVLGTMNTADRSIALMDTALRRRFEFVEVMPDSGLLGAIEVEGVDVARMLGAMNARVELLYDREHTLGHAFLMDLAAEPSIERLAKVFETRLIPLLQEYFFDDYAKVRSVLGAAADRFIEERDASDIFWDDEAADYDRLRSYRVLPAPRDAESYALIYKTARES